MPLLLCPNCDGSMQAVNRADVEFDMCPKCRGVWLDRGELEKLMALEREEAAGQAAAPPPRAQTQYQAPPQQHYAPPAQRYDEPRCYRDDDDDRHRHGQHGHHKKKRFDLFGIFD